MGVDYEDSKPDSPQTESQPQVTWITGQMVSDDDKDSNGKATSSPASKDSPAEPERRPRSFDEIKDVIIANKGMFKFLKITITNPITG